MKKKSIIAEDLRSPKQKELLSQKKEGKGSFKRKKK